MSSNQMDEFVRDLKRGSRTLAKGFFVLEFISDNQKSEGVRLTDVSKGLGLDKSTALRYLQTLVEMKYLQKDPDSNRYKLGIRVLMISTSFLSGLRIRDESSSSMNDLMLKTKHAVHLMILDFDSGEAVCVDKVDSPRPVRMYSYIGLRIPANCSASGKAIMAYLDESLLKPILSDLRSNTPKSIASPNKLRRELERIRVLGYSQDDEETMLGIRCVGAPIFDYTGRIIASVSVSGASTYFEQSDFLEFAPDVVEAAQSISERMGFRKRSPAELVSMYAK